MAENLTTLATCWIQSSKGPTRSPSGSIEAEIVPLKGSLVALSPKSELPFEQRSGHLAFGVEHARQVWMRHQPKPILAQVRLGGGGGGGVRRGGGGGGGTLLSRGFLVGPATCVAGERRGLC